MNPTDEAAKARAGVAGRIAPDRVPPHSDEAEISVLGGMLLEESAVDRAMELLVEDDFYHPAHRHIFRAASDLRDQGHAPDALTVREELRRRGRLEESGGDEYLARIVEIVPTAANLPYHARIVLDGAVKRRLIAAGTEIVSDAYQTNQEADQLLNRAEEKMFRLGEGRFKKAFTPINQLLQGAVMQLESLSARKESITGAPSGFKDLDDLTAGFQLSDLVIVAGRPSMGKCLAHDSEIVLADGRVLSIEEVCRRRVAEVLSLREDWTLGPAPVSRFVDDGLKPVFEVRTRLGRRIRTTLSHPFLTVDGWRPLQELRVGARVAVPRRIPVFGNRAMRECEIVLLAYLIGDGSLTRSSPTFTNGNERLLGEAADAVRRFGGATTRRIDSGVRTPSLRIVADPASVARRRAEFAARLDARLAAEARSARAIAREIGVDPATITFWRRGVCAPDATRFATLCAVLGAPERELAPAGHGSISKSSPGPVATWLSRHGLAGRRASDKHVPEAVFTLPRGQVALFLNRLFATDGWASVLASGQAQIGYASASERLARQVQHLLLRFGVVAALKRRRVRYLGGHRVAWQLDVTHRESIDIFVQEIGIFGKEEAVERIRATLRGRRRQVNRDVVPAECWQRIEEGLGGRSWADVARLLGKERGHNFHVGTRGLSRERLEKIAVAVADEELVQLARSDVWWDEIVSIETRGVQQVYDLTVERWHNFVGDDVCVHNTSFSLNIAAHAAIVEDLPVAIFSLEMSMEQLVQRLISTEALVSLKTLRTGQASSEQWKNVADACDRLRRAAIYIDDSSMLSALEMRAKARRLKQQRDIGLVVVDYLQLMVSGSRAENRQQEITEISRSLKALAKELNIPVIALSQLSRAPEHRGDARPKLADLRESGCLAGETPVYLPEEGLYRPIEELVGESGFHALALNLDSWTLEPAPVARVFSTGEKPVFRLTTRLGRTLRATGNHKFLAFDGWERLDRIEAGEKIALPRRLPGPTRPTMGRAELALLGRMIGDGCTLPRHAVQYTTNDLFLAENVSSYAIDVFHDRIDPVIRRERSWWQVYLRSATPLGRGRANPVADWLREMGAFGLRSHEKRVPERVFSQPPAEIAWFLRHLWATDGCIRFAGPGRHPALYYASSSERLARDVQSLLLRIGINAVLRKVPQSRGRDQYHVRVSGKPDVQRFLAQVGAAGGQKVEASERISTALQTTRANTNRDAIPREAWRREVVPAMAMAGVTSRRLQAELGQHYCGTALYKSGMSRERAGRVADIVGSEPLARLARSEVYWDEVVSVEPDGVEAVYDMTVPGHHNFVAGDVVVHNSIEQDADLVVFLYRDEYYNPDTSEKKGIAEIIVGKNRNGPTGAVELAFLQQFMRFENLDRFHSVS